MTGGGRPLRFLTAVMGCWVAARAAMLWPVDPVVMTGRAALPQAAAAPAPRGLANPLPIAGTIRVTHAMPIVIALRTHVAVAPVPSTVATDPWVGATLTPRVTQTSTGIVAGLPTPLSTLPAAAARSRFFGSAWVVARGGNGLPGGVPGVQLGGSQAGVRLGYALREDRRLALIGRVSSPLGHGLREGALGIEWQPTRLPVRVVAEQRFALGPGRGGPTLAAVGGIGPLSLAAGFRLEAYAQGGVIARDGMEGFADGALRVARPVATLGRIKVDLGTGAWGAAQRGATRLDVGPSLSAVIPIGPQPVRLSVDWRQRVAGNAAPGSGPVVTLGADF